MRILLTRLSDINTERDLKKYGCIAYGRFSLLRDGGLWFGDLHSSHPATTQVGWYWSIITNETLAVSARGAGIDGEMLIRERRDILAWLVVELVRRRFIQKPKSLCIVE